MRGERVVRLLSPHFPFPATPARIAGAPVAQVFPPVDTGSMAVIEAHGHGVVTEWFDGVDRHVRCGRRPHATLTAAETLRARTPEA